MTQILPRLELDLKGTNPNNYIANEPHVLSGTAVRAIAPKMGPFFADSLVVQDGANTLIRGTHYQLVELHQELTLKAKGEINSIILITDRNVSSNPVIHYHAVGSHFVQNNEAIGNLFQSLSIDERPVDWRNVLNKDITYQPTEHPHLIDDVFGWEFIVDMLERLRTGITLGQTRVVLDIIDNLMSKFTCKELPKVLPSSKLIQYDALLYFLSRRKILNDIWVDTKTCSWTKGQVGIIQVDTSGYPVGTELIWEFYQPNTIEVGLFTNRSGTFITNGGIVEISIYVPSDLNYDTKNMYIGIKETVDDVDYKAVTYALDIKDPAMASIMFPYLLNAPTEPGDGHLFLSELDTQDELRLYTAYTSY